ncbi:GNAT family N-acetyltransferase [Spirosoma arcticum]
MMTIIELTNEHPHDYKTFFMGGLHAYRSCFRISPDDEAREPFPTTGTADSFTLGLLTEAGTLAGVVSFQREGQTREKLRHKGLLFRMYVSTEHGGKGFGRQLLNDLIRRVREKTDVEQINLTVAATNESAKRLYERAGFRSFARELNALKDGDSYYDEEQMVLFLDR